MTRTPSRRELPIDVALGARAARWEHELFDASKICLGEDHPRVDDCIPAQGAKVVLLDPLGGEPVDPRAMIRLGGLLKDELVKRGKADWEYLDDPSLGRIRTDRRNGGGGIRFFELTG